MIFEQDLIVFEIIDVLYLDQVNISSFNANRNFDALSFRLEADTIIENNGKHMEFCNNSIGFFPADTDYTRISQKDKMIVVHFKTFNYNSTEVEFFQPEDCDKYRLLFTEILEVWRKKGISYKHNCASVLNRIFAELYRDNLPLDNMKSKIYPSVKYIKENYLKHDFSLHKAAQQSMISDTYFRKLFNIEFGTSPKKYVISRRIKHAASLIISGYFSLTEISEMCGFDDYKYFSVEFKKITGVSPSKYVYNYKE